MKKIILLIASLVWISGCTSLKTPEINGIVVDAETSKPIEGARVYAKWQKTVSGPGGQTGGAIAKELRLQVKEDGRFAIPAYTLRNYVPYPFGQGGTFYVVVYAHGYMYKQFTLFSTDSIRYESELKDFLNPKGISLNLKLISSPKEWRENLEAIPETTVDMKGEEVRNDYIDGEYKILVDRFGKSIWKDTNIQYKIADAYYRLGDYESALKKLDEIKKDSHDAESAYFKELYLRYKSRLKK